MSQKLSGIPIPALQLRYIKRHWQ